VVGTVETVVAMLVGTRSNGSCVASTTPPLKPKPLTGASLRRWRAIRLGSAVPPSKSSSRGRITTRRTVSLCKRPETAEETAAPAAPACRRIRTQFQRRSRSRLYLPAAPFTALKSLYFPASLNPAKIQWASTGDTREPPAEKWTVPSATGSSSRSASPHAGPPRMQCIDDDRVHVRSAVVMLRQMRVARRQVGVIVRQDRGFGGPDPQRR